MTSTSASDERHLWLCRIWTDINDPVVLIEGGGRVCMCDCFESRENEMIGIVDKMFGYVFKSASGT